MPLLRLDDSELSAALRRLWYAPGGYQGAPQLLLRLRHEAGATADIARIRRWLLSQELSVLERPTAPHRAASARHITESRPNALHHADLLFLPHDDSQGGAPQKYALVVRDAASRYTEARPLPNKEATTVAAALASIYTDGGPLVWPVRLHVDDGTEFRGAVGTALKKHKVIVYRGQPGDHTHTAFAERANQTIARRLFAGQYEKEFQTGETNREWVAALPAVIASMNSLPTRLIGMAPGKAVLLREIPQPKATAADKLVLLAEARHPVLKEGSRVRIVLPDTTEGGRGFRATDPRWTRTVHMIEEVRFTPLARSRPLAEYRVGGSPRWFLPSQLRRAY